MHFEICIWLFLLSMTERHTLDSVSYSFNTKGCLRGCTPTLISDLSKDANNSQVPEAETAIFMAAVDSPVLSRFLPPARGET